MGSSVGFSIPRFDGINSFGSNGCDSDSNGVVSIDFSTVMFSVLLETVIPGDNSPSSWDASDGAGSIGTSSLDVAATSAVSLFGKVPDEEVSGVDGTTSIGESGISAFCGGVTSSEGGFGIRVASGASIGLALGFGSSSTSPSSVSIATTGGAARLLFGDGISPSSCSSTGAEGAASAAAAAGASSDCSSVSSSCNGGINRSAGTACSPLSTASTYTS
mmetsp:Transcript_17894/g.36881  ORF Transcript_17894/g.36881 Transcript_17894/m.36881 type:complete len:218 (-) Transcript_17894:501-1154(-)